MPVLCAPVPARCAIGGESPLHCQKSRGHREATGGSNRRDKAFGMYRLLEMTIITGVGCRSCRLLAPRSRRAAYAAILPCEKIPQLTPDSHGRVIKLVVERDGGGCQKSRGHREAIETRQSVAY